MTAPKVRIKWNCPCGERNRWKHDRKETEGAPPFSTVTCQRCGADYRVRLKSMRYEVLP